MNEMMGIINLSASTERLKTLTEIRTIGSIPIGGRYRVIDFTLSNMVNSGVTNIAICTQGRARSLYDHVGSGKHWDLDRKKDGLFYFHPEASSVDIVQKKGDIEIFNSMLSYIRKSKQEYVFLSRSYMVCNVDLEDMLDYHKEQEADITILYKRMNNHVRRFVDCDTVNIDENDDIISMGKNLGKKKYYNVSMEMYIMKRELLIELIEESIHLGNVDYLKQCIFNQIGELKVKGFAFDGYLACINTIQNFYRTNMDMLLPEVQKELFHADDLIYTKIKDEPSTYYADDSYVSNSLVSSGCIIEGIVENSILSRGVHVKKGAIIRNSIVMQNSKVGETANINHMILDKNVEISDKRVFNGDVDHPFVIAKNSKV
ncbi:glucose-1-phosphate adenylyltransferase subunit GlgD [Acidaminobacter sp. JC074]|uniref:glucose-1-phosphate adenylyltransferase subunit GlgD n=1 Tax=Acidaminobacter sp. JC074 TaxID=2530199 RepID=UPI001F1174BE|nr:glucose-1-phosphate adenylyltransferase subunit GlgD [Acidaminobacter sp. JC074]MCH4890242.1 glucose-1-phosphate adenylyltransferase subunit GlgD [Acidaminobacter sp. JC074]